MTSYIEFNGIKSSDLGLKIYNEMKFVSPKKRYESIEIQGRDGDLYIDKESLSDIEKEVFFELNVKGNPNNGGDGSLIHKQALAISKWLNVKGFKDLKFSMYPDFTYKAMVVDPYNIEDTLRKRGKGVIKLIIKPIMYYNNYPKQSLSSGQNLINIGSIIAKPILYITPSQATLEIKKNGVVWLRLQNLEIGKEIIIDSEVGRAYTSTGNANSKMLINKPLFPLLNVGNNKITFTGATISILPRFGEVAI